MTRAEKAVIVIALKEAAFAREVELEEARRHPDRYEMSDLSTWAREVTLMKEVAKKMRTEITNG